MSVSMQIKDCESVYILWNWIEDINAKQEVLKREGIGGKRSQVTRPHSFWGMLSESQWVNRVLSKMLALHELDLISDGSHDLLMYWVPKTLVLVFPIPGTKGSVIICILSVLEADMLTRISVLVPNL